MTAMWIRRHSAASVTFDVVVIAPSVMVWRESTARSAVRGPLVHDVRLGASALDSAPSGARNDGPGDEDQHQRRADDGAVQFELPDRESHAEHKKPREGAQEQGRARTDARSRRLVHGCESRSRATRLGTRWRDRTSASTRPSAGRLTPQHRVSRPEANCLPAVRSAPAVPRLRRRLTAHPSARPRDSLRAWSCVESTSPPSRAPNPWDSCNRSMRGTG